MPDERITRADIDEMLQEIFTGELDTTSVRRQLDRLREMITASSVDTAELIELLIGRMLRFDANLLFRVQLQIDRGLRRHDQHAERPADDPLAVAEDALPVLAKIEDRVLDVARTYGRLRHLLELGRHRRDVLVDLKHEREKRLKELA